MEVKLIANENTKSPVSEAYRTIRTNLQFSQVIGKELKSILITSPTPNEGKSTTIANLGVVMAQAQKKVVVVDCDFRNPTQHKIFGVSNKGMSNCIATGEPLADVTVESTVPGLWVIPAGPVAPNPSELLGSEKMSELLKELGEQFDYVLVDAPPIMPVTDAAVLSSKVDGVMLLIASGEVAPAIAKEAKTRMEQGGAHILGVILNKVDVNHGHYGYGKGGYGYYYYYGDNGEKKRK